MELKVFTLPTCSSCSVVKAIAAEVAREFGVGYREINMATPEGLNEGLAHDIHGTPSIMMDEEVIVRGQVISRQRLSEEVRIRAHRWKERALNEQEHMK